MKKLPEHLLTLYALTGTISIAASQIVMAAGGLLAIVDRGRGVRFRWTRTGLEWPLVAWALATILATLLAADFWASADKLRKLPLWAMVFWAPAVVHRAWGLGRLYMGLFFSAGATALYGVLTFFLQGGPEMAVRIRGFHTFYVTNSGLLLLCTFPALLFACSRGFAPSYRAGAGIAAAAILAAQLFGRLPSAWLGTGAGLLILALRRGRPRLAALVPMLAVVLLLAPGLFRETARDLLDPSSPANTSRARIWENGWRLFASDVWSGAGLQDLREEYRRIVGPDEEVHGNMASVPVHVAASMGAPGLVALAWLVVAFFRVLGHARQGAQGDLLRATVDGVEASFVAFLAAGLLEWNLGDSEILALLCFLVGTAIAAGRLGGAAAPARVA